MPGRRIPTDMLFAKSSAAPRSRRPSWWVRLAARLRAGTYDRQLAVGVPPAPGSALAAHRSRVVSPEERRHIAHTLCRALRESRRGTSSLSRLPLSAENIGDAEDLIDRVIARLHSSRPVCERGMARLRLVLTDGTGPLYRHGRGDLRGRLGAALAELY